MSNKLFKNAYVTSDAKIYACIDVNELKSELVDLYISINNMDLIYNDLLLSLYTDEGILITSVEVTQINSTDIVFISNSNVNYLDDNIIRLQLYIYRDGDYNIGESIEITDLSPYSSTLVYHHNNSIFTFEAQPQYLESNLITNSAYPVGSTYITSTYTSGTTETELASMFGGTWELYDKKFKAQTISITENLTKTSNIYNVSYAIARITNDEIQIRLSWSSKVAVGDSTIEFFTLPTEEVGITDWHHTNGWSSTYFTAWADAGNGIAMMECTSAGLIQSVDVVTRSSGGTIAASTSSSVNYPFGASFYRIVTSPLEKINSFCDKFYFKRTE